MKNIIAICIAGLFIISTFGAVAQQSDVKTQDKSNLGDRVFTHTVFAEDATAMWCGYCHYAREALDKIYSSGDYPFYYVCMVDDMNIHAAARNTGYNVYGFPTVFFDGGNKVSVGGGTGNEAQYRSYITQTGSRTVKDINVTLTVSWKGNALMDITALVHNNEAIQYDGQIRVYVTEVESSMGWHDTTGHPYTFPFLDYAFNQTISIASGNTWTNSILWDGHNYNDGYGHNFGSIQYGNIMVIATVFNSEWHQGYANPPSGYPFNAYWVDDTAGFWVGTNRPPNVPSNPNPTNASTNVDLNKDLSWTGGDPDPSHDTVTYDVYFGTSNPPPLVSSNQSATTYDPGTMAYTTPYYWQIVATDNHGSSTLGHIWHFTTINTPNQPPSAPSISGPSTGKTKTIYSFVLTATDPDLNQLYYLVDWGDNTTTDWNGSYASGEAVSLTHSWNIKETYTVKAKTKDVHGAESDWGTLSITIPTNQYIPHHTLLELLQKIFGRFPWLERLLFH